MDLKNIVLDGLKGTEFEKSGIEKLLVCNSGVDKGEISLPCFALAKELHKSPIAIAEEIKKSIEEADKSNQFFEKIDTINGYINFFVKKDFVIKQVQKEVIPNPEIFGATNIGEGKTVFFDYSSPNMAKYLHIGHLKTTFIGDILKKIYSFLGFKTVGINYIGDYGLPFGKMIVAYKHWGKDSEIKKKGIDAIQDLYVKFHKEETDNPELMAEAQEWSKKIEEKDPEALRIYNWFIDISKKEAEKIYKLLDVSFDSWRGESYYTDKMDPVIKELSDRKILITSEGAKGVDLSEYGMGFCLIKRSDGVSLYATRDLAAVEDRYQNYHFDKGIYVTDVAQKLHFQQWFKCVDLMKKPYAGKLQHVAYGRYSLTTGKIASRMGKQALIIDLYNGIYQKALEIVKEKGYSYNIEEVAAKITRGALRYETVKTEIIKDSIFNPDSAMSFEGESSPYMQYTYARCCSILNKCGGLSEKITGKEIDALDTTDLSDDTSFSIIKQINEFPNVIRDVYNRTEPFLLTQYLISLCSLFNKYYNSTRIIENGIVNNSRAQLVKMIKIVLTNGLNLLGIPLIEKM